jgi:3-dehydrosphinganine reductase
MPTGAKHALVTGGSKGIGFHIARSLLLLPTADTDKITLLARNKKDLEQAQKDLEAEFSDAKVHIVVADTTNEREVRQATAQSQETLGPIDILICNAGLSIPKNFTDTSIEDFERQIDVNYLGAVRTVHAVLPGMLSRESGHIMFISSVMGVLGFAGYSSYAPSKWAVRGFADCLRNELSGSGVGVSIAYPPDTETPGYEKETEIKSELCKRVNDALGSILYTPDAVAGKIVKGYVSGKYHLCPPDLGSTMLISMMTGLTRPGVFWLGIQMMLAPVLLIVAWILTKKADDACAGWWKENSICINKNAARTRSTRSTRERQKIR